MWLEAQELKRQGLITRVEWLNDTVFETKPNISIIRITDKQGFTPLVASAFVMWLTSLDGKQLVCIELIGCNGKEDFTGLMVEVNQMVSIIITASWIIVFIKELYALDLGYSCQCEWIFKVFIGFILICLSKYIINKCKGFSAKTQINGENKDYLCNYKHIQ